ncbi:MAG: TetR family transcriptional regulator [Solirubrobacterales bacterium]|nr:TetR family transcriptional regulator [Solirubrobacterales bacterium]
MSTSTQFERERLLDAMLEEMVVSGPDGAEVEAALQRAGLEGEEWLAEFLDKDSCLFAAYEQLIERLARKTGEGCALGENWPQRVRCGLEYLLEELAGAPAVAALLIRAFPALSPAARARYQEFVESFAPLLAGGRELSEMGEELPGEVEMLAVGAAEAIVFEEIEAGRAAQLLALAPAILFSVLVPFLGPEGASAEMQRASEAAERRDLEAA